MLFLYDTIGQHVVQILASLILDHFLEPFYRLYKERQHTLEKRRLFFVFPISNCLFCAQNATSTKAEAERTFAEVTDLDNEVNNMLKQLQEAEKELKKKQDDADQDMMMAGMVSDSGVFARGQKVKAVP